VGTVSPNGAIVIKGRAAGDVNFLGTRIRLDDVRRAVRGVDGVLDTRVSAVPHPVYGECPVVRVLVRSLADASDSTERAVRIALSANIGKAASAVVVELVDPRSLPESGKL
jgi:acyl-coenzyme A synthetase/AMP-(fatty) acid ligase